MNCKIWQHCTNEIPASYKKTKCGLETIMERINFKQTKEKDMRFFVLHERLHQENPTADDDHS